MIESGFMFKTLTRLKLAKAIIKNRHFKSGGYIHN